MKVRVELKKYLKNTVWIAKDTKAFIWPLILIIASNALTSLAFVAIAIVSKNLIDNAVKGNMNAVIINASVFGAIIVLSLGLRAYSSVVTVKTSESFCNHLRERLFSRILRTKWVEVSKYHSGDVLTRLTSDISNVSTGVTNTLPSIISLGVQLVASFATLLYYEPYLAVLAFVLGPFTVLSTRLMGRKLKQLQIKVQESESLYRSFLQESLQNILILKAFQLEEKSGQKIRDLHSNRMKWVIKRNKLSVAASTTLGMGYWVGYFLAFCWGVVRLGRGTTTFGTMTAFLQLVQQVQGPFIGLSMTLPQVISAMASAGRLMEFEALTEEKVAAGSTVPNSAAISCQRVSFQYVDGQPILQKVSFSVRPGEIVALIGQSGEGKTTLIRALLAFLMPNSGTITLSSGDGLEKIVSAETRAWISYVPQGNTLFSGTIADNIWCGCEEASLDDVMAAAKAANAWEFIEELENGLNTVIGERGVGLSEGQAQRIAIARALLHKTPILILDEATSALDMESEMHVLKSIQEMQPKRTCIVITHRPSAMRICSRVLKLHEGKLSEVVKDLESGYAKESEYAS